MKLEVLSEFGRMALPETVEVIQNAHGDEEYANANMIPAYFYKEKSTGDQQIDALKSKLLKLKLNSCSEPILLSSDEKENDSDSSSSSSSSSSTRSYSSSSRQSDDSSDNSSANLYFSSSSSSSSSSPSLSSDNLLDASYNEQQPMSAVDSTTAAAVSVNTTAATSAPTYSTISSLKEHPLYRMQDKIRSGGYGVVYKGVRKADNAPIAIKVIDKKNIVSWIRPDVSACFVHFFVFVNQTNKKIRIFFYFGASLVESIKKY